MKIKQKAKRMTRRKSKAKERSVLTFSERLRLKDIKKTLAGEDKKGNKPTTAQQTITFKQMFKDGVCRVTKNYYTRMVEFFDINYNMLELEDQGKENGIQHGPDIQAPHILKGVESRIQEIHA